MSPSVTFLRYPTSPPVTPSHCHHHRTSHRPLGHHHLSPPQDTSHVTCFFKKVDILYGQPLNIHVNYFLVRNNRHKNPKLPSNSNIYFCSLMTSPFSDPPPPPCHLLVTFLEVPPLPPFL